MERSSNQSINKPHSLIRHSEYPESQCGVVPDIHPSLDEAALWEELESKKRSAEYHLGQYHEYLGRCLDTVGDPVVLDHSQG